jgi:hypothetical protein
MSEDEMTAMFDALRKVGLRFRGIQHVNSVEMIEPCDLVLFEAPDVLPRNCVCALPVSECSEMQLLLHITAARRRWSYAEEMAEVAAD